MNLMHRLYSDFLLPERWGEYDLLLSTARDRDYEILSIERMWRLLQEEKVDPKRKYLILRHDIDTDPAGAHNFLCIELKHGVTASYYFRLSTVDIPLMKEIAEQGGEVGYHFEEIATYCKLHGIKDVALIPKCLPEIEELFAHNLTALRQRTGLPMTIVASHGDWLNGRLGVANTLLTKNHQLRKRLGIELEVYDDAFMRHVTSRHSDQGYPLFWQPGDARAALEKQSQIVYVLTHTRHWRSRVAVNAVENAVRLMEEVRYRMAW